jgi:DNA-binding winged helix-turn-helix (wHTH) protein
VHIIVFSNKNYLVEFLTHQTQYSLKHYKLLEEFDTQNIIETSHVIIEQNQEEIPERIYEILNIYAKSKIILLLNAKSAIELKSCDHCILTQPIDLNKLLSLLQEFSLPHEAQCVLTNELVLLIKHKKLLTAVEEINLTEKEVAILHYLYRHKENYVSKNKLLRAVWQHQEILDTHTLETHIYRLRQKLGKYGEIILSDASKGGYTLGGHSLLTQGGLNSLP